MSNPPYIPACDMPGLMDGVRLFEDHGALCGGGDGLNVVRQLLEEAPALLVPTAAAAATTVEAGAAGAGGSAGSCSGSAISDGSSNAGSSTKSTFSATGLLSGFEDIGNVWLEVDSSHPETLRAMLPPSSLASSCKPLPSLAPASSTFASTTCVASTVSLALPAATPEEPKSAISTTKSLQPAVQPAGGLNCSAADPDGKGVFWVSSHLDFGGLPRFCVLGTSRPPLAE